MVDERMKKDDKSNVKRRGGMKDMRPKWATFASAKSITSTEEQKNSQKYKNTLRNNEITNKFRNFWRHDNVS